MLAPALTAIAYLGLKKRQCAILVMRVKFIWNGALLRLQGKQASAAGM